jgi:apolipoprotein D and lipocalin family protein
LAVGGVLLSSQANAQQRPDATASSDGANPAGFIANQTAVQAIPELDVDRYMGTWFEVAKFPNYFQRKCASDTQATYSKRADGRIDVVNRCKTSGGAVEAVRGIARPDTMAPMLPSKLQVRFAPAWLSWLPLVWGRYWVVILDPDYRYAVVSEPRRKYLWILSRSAHMDNAQYDDIVERIAAKGFDTRRLVRSAQN